MINWKGVIISAFISFLSTLPFDNLYVRVLVGSFVSAVLNLLWVFLFIKV